MRNKVVLPQPEGPRRLKNSPRLTLRSIPASASSPLAKRLPTPRSSTMGSGEVSAAGPAAGACSAPQDLGLVLGVIDDRCRLGAAVAGIDHRVQGVAELVGDLPSLGHGLVLTRQQQGARHERLAELGEQCTGHRVPGDPHPDGLLSRVLQPARYLPGRGQDEGVAARRCRLDSPEHRVGDARELAELGEVLAHQREVVPVIKVADRPDPRDAVGVAELAAERIAGVRRVGDHAARADDIGDLGDRARLRAGRMDVEVPGHATSLGASFPAGRSIRPVRPVPLGISRR